MRWCDRAERLDFSLLWLNQAAKNIWLKYFSPSRYGSQDGYRVVLWGEENINEPLGMVFSGKPWCTMLLILREIKMICSGSKLLNRKIYYVYYYNSEAWISQSFVQSRLVSVAYLSSTWQKMHVHLPPNLKIVSSLISLTFLTEFSVRFSLLSTYSGVSDFSQAPLLLLALDSTTYKVETRLNMQLCYCGHTAYPSGKFIRN